MHKMQKEAEECSRTNANAVTAYTSQEYAQPMERIV